MAAPHCCSFALCFTILGAFDGQQRIRFNKPITLAPSLKSQEMSSTACSQWVMESEYKQEMQSDGFKKLGLISSLQFLGHFSALLCPPALVADTANLAARKAVSFIYRSIIEEGESITGIHAHANAITKAGCPYN